LLKILALHSVAPIQEKASILAKLKQDILLQQCSHAGKQQKSTVDLGGLNNAFPQGSFPIGALHEFHAFTLESHAASMGFLSGILGSLTAVAGTVLWITATQNMHPPALTAFCIAPERVVFIHLKKEKELQWAVEEALKCSALTAVVAEMQSLDFTTSRKLQLATEGSGVTGFIVRRNARAIGTTACAARWKISPVPSIAENGLPGLGFPRWNVELLKVRNGKAGTWQMEWAAGSFREALPVQETKFSPLHKIAV